MGSQPPTVYLKQLETEAGLPSNWLDDIVATHLIDARFLRGRPHGLFEKFELVL
jgi:hypothetical protein